MKLIFKSTALLFLLAFISCNKSKAQYVHDNANVFTEEEVSKLNKRIGEIDKKTTVQILVYVTTTLNDKSVQEYGLEIGNKYGVGKKGVNNGVVILLALYDREMNISVGHGLEWILSDSKCDTIRIQMTQLFSNNEFCAGVEKGLFIMENLVSKYNWNIKSTTINNISEKDSGKIIKFNYSHKGNEKFKYALNSDQQFSSDFKISLKEENKDLELYYTKYMNSYISKIISERNIIIYARLIDWKTKHLELLGIEE